MKYFAISLVLATLIVLAIAESETKKHNSTTAAPETTTDASEKSTSATETTTADLKTTAAPKKTKESSRRSRCYSSQFECVNGQCININLVCNGYEDCRDGSDEHFNVCFTPGGRATTTTTTTTTTERSQGNGIIIGDRGDFSCTDDEFLCTSGECISRAFTCDGRRNCNDGSDEFPSICPKIVSKNCLASEFQCRNGECILGGYRCDGVAHCSDSSDEDRLICQTVSPNKPVSTTQRPANTGRPLISNPDNTESNNWGERLIPCNVPSQPANGRWRLHRSLCNSNIECNPPPNIRTMDPGSYLVYNCDRGFVLNGTSDVLCGPGGQWIYEPRCDQIKCHDLSTSTTEALCMWNNVAVSCEIPVPVGTTAELNCRKGFVQEVTYDQGYRKVKCQPDGKWSPRPIQCVKKPKKVKLVVTGDMILED